MTLKDDKKENKNLEQKITKDKNNGKNKKGNHQAYTVYSNKEGPQEKEPENKEPAVEQGSNEAENKGQENIVSQSIEPVNQVEDKLSAKEPQIIVRNLNFFYGKHQALFDNNIEIYPNTVLAIIGPSGCGKSTHIRIYNRIFEMYREQRAEGEIIIDGENILSPSYNLIQLRKKVGMIFQKPTPFPMSIFENVAYGLKLHYRLSKNELHERVRTALKRAALLDEVENKLDAPALSLSGGQQQRLCIARAIAVEPEILLMDEPTSAIDPIATAKIEELIEILKKDYTIVIVTHNMQQAARIADFTAFFYRGYIVEVGKTKQLFQNPKMKQTEDYITGRFG